MQPTSSLETFISHARTKGMDHQTIRMLLLSAGWKERDIVAAMSEQGLDMPVPVPPDAGGARDAFYHLLAFAGLYTTVISFLVLAFSYINHWLPDSALEPYATEEGFRSSIRWSLAALIVAFPIYGWISHFLLREMRLHIEKGSSAIRRWLTYLTLFVAASALIGDVITIVYSLLNGEITLRFILKAGVIFLVTGSCFTYYFHALRTSISEQKRMHLRAGILAAVVVLAAVVYGMFLSGSPATERLRKIDANRVSDIRTIADATLDIVYGTDRWTYAPDAGLKKNPLPKSLEEIATKSQRQRVSVVDGDGNPYVYSVKGSTHFSICTTFTFENREQFAPFWDHPAGEYCYAFDASETNLP